MFTTYLINKYFRQASVSIWGEHDEDDLYQRGQKDRDIIYTAMLDTRLNGMAWHVQAMQHHCPKTIFVCVVNYFHHNLKQSVLRDSIFSWTEEN